jgi:hypothetical protein
MTARRMVASLTGVGTSIQRIILVFRSNAFSVTGLLKNSLLIHAWLSAEMS